MNNTKTPLATKPSVALLIDGENISVSFAGRIIVRAAQLGNLTIKRVYGNAARITGWDATPGFRLLHSGSIKNGADILLSIDAVHLSHAEAIDTFAIVTSDQDFSHLAHYLRERGFSVVGYGEVKAPDAFRKACSSFVELTNASDILPKNLDKLDTQIHAMIKGEPNNEIRIALLSSRMNTLHGVRISSHKLKTWRAYLASKDSLYNCDPKGPTAKVRLAPRPDAED